MAQVNQTIKENERQRKIYTHRKKIWEESETDDIGKRVERGHVGNNGMNQRMRTKLMV